MIQNARIKSTTLGVEDHGIFTLWLHLDFGGSEQGFGGYSLDEWSAGQKRRIGTAFGCDFITEILRTMEVETWEELPGAYCRVDGSGLGSTLDRIGHPLKDQWFDPKELAAKHGAGNK